MSLTLIELLDQIKFVLQNEKRLVFSDNYRHYDLCEGLCVRKTDANNHLILTVKNGDYLGNEVARIKPVFPQSARYIIINLESLGCTVHYYGITNIENECIKNEIKITYGTTIVEFEMPVSRDEYFNNCLMYDIKVQYEEILKISEVSLLLSKDRNGIII